MTLLIISRLAGDIGETAEMIAFKHTVFALPFAVISLITAADPGWSTLRVWVWVLVAMVSARTAAMSLPWDVDSDEASNMARFHARRRRDRLGVARRRYLELGGQQHTRRSVLGNEPYAGIPIASLTWEG